MLKVMVATAAAAFLLGLAAASAVPFAGGPRPAVEAAVILAEQKQGGTIPANCTMDPFKKVYHCCTHDAQGHITCTDTPYGKTKQLQFQSVQPQQTQPQLFQQNPSQ